MVSKSRSKSLILIIGFCVFLFSDVSLLQAQVKPGDVIDSSNWQKAVDVVVPSVLEMLKTHGLVIHVTESKEYPINPKFVEATKKYSPFYKVENNLMDYKAGLPFADIDPKDGKAGTKVAFNLQYHSQPENRFFSRFGMFFINKNGTLERSALGRDYLITYTGRVLNPPVPEIPNTEGIVFKEFLQMYDPKDVAGVGFLLIRYKSVTKDDDAFAYVPSLRRVRRTSSLRLDTFMGADEIQEDFYGFSGKITEFEWKLIGKKRILAMRNTGKEPVARGGKYKWCIWDVPWELRDVWILESIPKIKGHPYGKRILYIDSQWYDTLFSEMFDKKGNLWRAWHQPWYWRPEVNWFTWPGDTVVDFQAMHATFSEGICDPNDKSITPEKFTLDALERFGR